MGWCRWWFLFAGSKFVGSPCILQFLQILRTEVSPSTQLTTWSCPGSFCSSKPDQHVVLVSAQSNGKIHVLWNQIKSNQTKSNQIKSNQIKSNQIKSNQIKSTQIKSNQIKSNQIKSNHIFYCSNNHNRY